MLSSYTTGTCAFKLLYFTIFYLLFASIYDILFLNSSKFILPTAPTNGVAAQK